MGDAFITRRSGSSSGGSDPMFDIMMPNGTVQEFEYTPASNIDTILFTATLPCLVRVYAEPLLQTTDSSYYYANIIEVYLDSGATSSSATGKMYALGKFIQSNTAYYINASTSLSANLKAYYSSGLRLHSVSGDTSVCFMSGCTYKVKVSSTEG